MAKVDKTTKKSKKPAATKAKKATVAKAAAPATSKTVAIDKEVEIMSVAKIIEISSESKKSFEDAVKSGIKKASKSVKNIQGAWISEQKVLIEKGEVVGYRVTMRLTFVLE